MDVPNILVQASMEHNENPSQIPAVRAHDYYEANSTQPEISFAALKY